MKLVIIPGFLGYAEESHHLDLVERAKLIGIEGIVVESDELSSRKFNKYILSSHIATVNRILNKYRKEELVVVGVSLGGVVACMASLDRPNVRGLACVVSPYKFGVGDDMQSKLSQWRSQGYYEFNSSRYGQVAVEYAFVADAQKFDAREVIPEISCQKLFLAGSLDVRVPYGLTEELANTAYDPKIYRLLDGMRHDYKNQPEFLNLVNDYILEYLVG